MLAKSSWKAEIKLLPQGATSHRAPLWLDVPSQIWYLPNISLSPYRQLVRQLAYQLCYTRYHAPLNPRLTGSALKHCKVPKYYDQDCRYHKFQLKLRFWPSLPGNCSSSQKEENTTFACIHGRYLLKIFHTGADGHNGILTSPLLLVVNTIIRRFNLIILYCLKTVYNIRFFKYFSLYCLFSCRFQSLLKIFYLKRFILFLKNTKCYFLQPNIWLSRKIYWCIVLRRFTQKNIHED